MMAQGLRRVGPRKGGGKHATGALAVCDLGPKQQSIGAVYGTVKDSIVSKFWTLIFYSQKRLINFPTKNNLEIFPEKKT